MKSISLCYGLALMVTWLISDCQHVRSYSVTDVRDAYSVADVDVFKRAQEEFNRRQKIRMLGELLIRTGTAVPSKPPYHRDYKVIRCKRESGCDFAYSFELALTESNTSKAMTEIQRDFRDIVIDDYMKAFPNADIRSLVVDFPEYRQIGISVEGRAVVLTITPTSLTYNANTRRGSLSVQFNAGQTEEARVWIRKNIETLARDKNIALVTGRPPPAANCYLLDEKANGNVMEIEFRTE